MYSKEETKVLLWFRSTEGKQEEREKRRQFNLATLSLGFLHREHGCSAKTFPTSLLIQAKELSSLYAYFPFRLKFNILNLLRVFIPQSWYFWQLRFLKQNRHHLNIKYRAQFKITGNFKLSRSFMAVKNFSDIHRKGTKLFKSQQKQHAVYKLRHLYKYCRLLIEKFFYNFEINNTEWFVSSS